MRRSSLRSAKAAAVRRDNPPGSSMSGEIPRLLPSGASSLASSFAAPPSSGRTLFSFRKIKRYLLMGLYILVFVVQQLFMQQILSKFPIVSATMNLMTFIAGVALATCMTAWSYGMVGLRHAWSGWQIVRFLPVGVLFGLSQSMIFMAYAHHVTASIVTVLGFIYLPVAAILKRSLLNSYTLWLIFDDFGEMEANNAASAGSSDASMDHIGIWFVITS
eukprot:CAMPEP_0170321568 /NCGR_PEP_ID=MMETSP0116_2-20130129/61547_1 /TAXON_ID=400756 /ORGANISM="Durinskia baltica, Strain CSIRO CS-38" /LENGTH=217 /DNA_ID=CAMNT_0010574397 /DNA_START=174 /DNA_END=824 /DNA_ORIENTATION=-